MAKYWCYFLFLLWFSYLIISSILLFTNGFLLSRDTLNKSSTCINFSERYCTENRCTVEDKLKASIQNEMPVCLPPKGRVVWLIIDAFRYDFALFDDNIRDSLPYQNKLPIISELLDLYPQTTRLYKFIADPPTTTMQRLKALTTGSLPTFIDAGSNFATAEIDEDNLIDQLVRQNQTAVFLGDDTWMGLYPDRFTRSYPFPSFNVWDLDTVDTGISNNIYSELNKRDWNLLIGHYLGVDHCGHRYGPNHQEMARKLSEINEVIRNVTNTLDDDVILFVVGDHGMTSTGDHGGESSDETTSTLFVYSKLPLIQHQQKENVVKQVDLIPTLSTILGIPIPYASLGTVILNCLPTLNDNPFDWREILPAVWMNVQQISTYIKQYSSTTNIFSDAKMKKLEMELEILKGHIPKLSNNVQFTVFLDNSGRYISGLREMCEEIWVQFDSFSMSRGLLFLFLTLFFVYTIIDSIPTARLSEIFIDSFIIYLYLSLLIAVIISTVLYFLNLITSLLTNIFFLSGIISVFMLAMLVVQNWEVISLHWYESSRKRNWIEIICRFVLLISLSAYFSNSFVLQEAYVNLFLLVTLIVVTLFDLTVPLVKKDTRATRNSIPVIKKSIKIKIIGLTVFFCILVRISMYFWQCREEHNCENSANASNKRSNSTRLEWILSLISLAALVTLTRMWLRSCGNLIGYSVTTLLARYAPTVAIVCSGGFWVLHNLPTPAKVKLVLTWQTNSLAWLVYAVTILGITLAFIKPLSVYMLPKKREVEVSQQGNVIPQLFKQIKSSLNEESDGDNVPIIYGLATVYSTVFIMSSVYIVLLFALLLGDALAPAAVLQYFSAAIVMIITSVSRYQKADNVVQLLSVPPMSILIWVMLSTYFFYGTGHQPTFPNIAWEAAFVGTSGVFTYNFIPATLIIINTFGSYIVIGFMLPLLQIAPFTVYVIITSLANKKNEMQKDLSRGDVILYENNHLLLNNTFVLCCKYLSCHALRVFASMLSATIHCRHLMVWNIFAPRFVFEGIAMFVTIPSVLFGYLLLVRVNNAVDRLVKGLNKQSR